MTDAFLHGTVHEASEDLQAALRHDAESFALWQGLTPLGRNEFICWVEDAKQAKTRQRRIARTCEELREGKRRPCCWRAASIVTTRRKASGKPAAAKVKDGS